MPRRIRPPVEDDAHSVLDVIQARDVADLGVPDFTLEDLRADWSGDQTDIEHDARVAVGTHGAVRAYAILLGDDAVVYVHPEAEGEGNGTVLRRWAEARAAERGTAILRQFAYGSNDGARRHLADAGYELAQHYFRLRADLADVPPPPDITLRTFDPADEAEVHRVVQEAFADLEGYRAQTLEQWRSKGPAKEGHDPSLWLLLEDEEGVAGVALGERWEDGTGYVAELAVAARARGHGHGRSLLLALFDAFRGAGLRHAELSVHGRNRGALRLYESAGMRTVWQAERWEKALGSR
jgi:ribosomal protein S18 acetylase RimI-like enzyme